MRDHEETKTMNATARIATFALGLVAMFLALAAPAFATEPITSFHSTISTDKVGGHPDIVTEFALAEPGVNEAARNIIFNTPEGVFGNPKAISRCTSLDFALDECPSVSQAGLITLRSNYEGDPNYLLGTAPIYDLDPGADKPAVFAFVVPTLNIPISIPVSVRTGSDYGLRFTVSNITQLAPLAEAKMTLWGFPALEAHDEERFPKGSPGSPAGCPGEEGTGCIEAATTAAIAIHPLTDNPTVCTGESLPVTLDVQTYQDPENLSHAEVTYPPITECENETFKPVLFSAPTTKEADSASGLDISLRDPAGTRLRCHSVRDPFRHRHLARRPDDQPRRCGRPAGVQRQPARSGLRGACRLPRQCEDRYDRHPLDRARRDSRRLDLHR